MRRPTDATLLLAAIVGLTFVASLFVGTRANAFPFLFHPDEPSKAEQIALGEYNFNHPQLELQAGHLIAWLRTGDVRGLASPDEVYLPHRQRIVQSGRLASAGFTALAGAIFAGLACAVRGPIAGIAVGSGLVVCPGLVANAHFFKEDAAFIFTIAVWLTAAAWHVRRRSTTSLVVFVVACGLAVCGKWIGGLLTIYGFALIAAIAPRDRRLRHASVLSLALVPFLLVNLPIFWQFHNVIAGSRHEASHIATGHEGLILPRWPVYVAELWTIGPILLGLAGYEGYVLARCPERRWAAWWLVPTLAVGLLLIVLMSRVVSPRYVLPTVVLLVVLGGMGLSSLAADLATKVKTPVVLGVAAILLAVGLVMPGLRSYQYLRVFQHDTRLDLRAWVQSNLQPGDKLAHDAWTGLWHWDVPVESSRLPLALADTTVEKLAAEGFTHLAIADRSYEQFFVPGVRVTDDYAETYEIVRARYSDLLDHQPIVEFSPTTPTPPHMSPRVLVYRLPIR